MPDWSYQTLFRPLLFRLPARLSRSLTLQSIGLLSRLPSGSFVIRTLGHMELSPLLERSITGISVHSPIGLSGSVDPQGTAHRALAQFGFGFIEQGPVTVNPIRMQARIENDSAVETIRYPSYFENVGVERVAERMKKPGHQLPQFVRITPMPDSSPKQALQEFRTMISKLELSGAAAGFYIDIFSGSRDLESSLAILKGIHTLKNFRNITERPFFLYVPTEFPNDKLIALLNKQDASIWSGVVIGEAIRDGDCEEVRVGRDSKPPTLDKIRSLRSHFPTSLIIKAGGGVHEPQDALDLMQAGANYVMLHSGLVYAGPGLPKRINEAIIYEQVRHTAEPNVQPFWKYWGYMCLLGIGMIVGGILAWIIAKTTVLLPYDLDFLGMTASEIHLVNHRILHFMSHDRITLAGTMISIGILYYQLAKYGLKHNQHWAKTALMTSGIFGFSSFFLYLGYGYFDPLHALAAAVLFHYSFFLCAKKQISQIVIPSIYIMIGYGALRCGDNYVLLC